MRYKITVEAEDPTSESTYDRYKTVYTQIVEGDETVVSGVVQTVLDYSTSQNAPATGVV
jgi:hypothetical protein